MATKRIPCSYKPCRDVERWTTMKPRGIQWCVVPEDYEGPAYCSITCFCLGTRISIRDFGRKDMPYSIYNYGDVYTLQEFIDMVNNGSVTDDDGSGVYCYGKGEDHKALSCREIIKDNVIDYSWSHVVWYNK